MPKHNSNATKFNELYTEYTTLLLTRNSTRNIVQQSRITCNHVTNISLFTTNPDNTQSDIC